MSGFFWSHLNDNIDCTENHTSCVHNPVCSSAENIRRTFQPEYAWTVDIPRRIILSHSLIHVSMVDSQLMVAGFATLSCIARPAHS